MGGRLRSLALCSNSVSGQHQFESGQWWVLGLERRGQGGMKLGGRDWWYAGKNGIWGGRYMGRSCPNRNPLLRERVRAWVFLLIDHFLIWGDSMYEILHFLLDSYPSLFKFSEPQVLYKMRLIICTS